MTREHIQFVTGRLAAPALEDVLRPLASSGGFDYSIDVLPITVAALMTTDWIRKHWNPDDGAARIVIPGYCGGSLELLGAASGKPVERGPRDLRALPEYFGQAPAPRDYGDFSIEILAEINHAPRASLHDVVRQARSLVEAGADIIDLGCDPGTEWREVGDYVKALRDLGIRVSIDSFEPQEIAPAVSAGAELVLSVNRSNREAAADWGCEVVAIPDEPTQLQTLEETAEFLEQRRVPYRLDPIIEPIGCGFAASLGRYLSVRQAHPEAAMMMGIGNLTELTDCDSAGINVLLLGFCQELQINSVLTTQVIPWARTAVRECDLGRRLVHYAVRHGLPPKHLEERLVTLRDGRSYEQGDDMMERLAASVRDHHVRIFAERGRIHVVTRGLHLEGDDPVSLFAAFVQRYDHGLDVSHAFYLGYEFCKAATALTLDKQYRQDEALDWGYLTQAEIPHGPRRFEQRNDNE